MTANKDESSKETMIQDLEHKINIDNLLSNDEFDSMDCHTNIQWLKKSDVIRQLSTTGLSCEEHPVLAMWLNDLFPVPFLNVCNYKVTND